MTGKAVVLMINNNRFPGVATKYQTSENRNLMHNSGASWLFKMCQVQCRHCVLYVITCVLLARPAQRWPGDRLTWTSVYAITQRPDHKMWSDIYCPLQTPHMSLLCEYRTGPISQICNWDWPMHVREQTGFPLCQTRLLCSQMPSERLISLLVGGQPGFCPGSRAVSSTQLL